MGTCCTQPNQGNIYVIDFSTLSTLNFNASVIQKAFRSHQNRKKNKNTAVISVTNDSQRSQDHHEPIQIPPNVIIEQSKEISLEPIDHAPPLIYATKLEKTPTTYHPTIQSLIYKIGNFQYKEYLKKQSQWYVPTEEDISLPYLEPYELLDGTIYIGQWKFGKRQCKGKAIFRDQSVYEGFWNEDQQTGFGRILFPNGDYFEGEFYKNKVNGQGKQVTVKGYIFEGNWVDEKQEGQGEETWPDGTKFKGKYINGQKSGEGEICFSDGSKYTGAINNNKFKGKGTMIFKDGSKYTGQWQDNLFHGYGVFNWPDGRQYEGYVCSFFYYEYLKDLKHGYGEMQYGDGSMYKGDWKEGKEDGKGTFVSRSGLYREGEWEKGKRVRWTTNYFL